MDPLYFFWGKDLLSEFSAISLLCAGIKSFFMLPNLLYLPALFCLFCWIIMLSRAQFKNWRLFLTLSGILFCLGFGFMLMVFLTGCCYSNRALSVLNMFMRWKSFAGALILVSSLFLLVWSLIRPRRKEITWPVGLLSTGLFGLAFGLSLVFRVTDDLQYLMRTITDPELADQGLSLLFVYALGTTLPVVFLLVLCFLLFVFSRNRQYPPVLFFAVAFLILAMTGILMFTGHLGVYGPLFVATLIRG